MHGYLFTFLSMETPLFRTREDVWNVIFMCVFLILILMVSLFLDRTTLGRMSAFDVCVLIAAVFRLIRLVSYDKITYFLRDYLANSVHPFKRTLFELVICPWCTGVWATLFSVALYLLFPGLWLFFLILAVSGVASFFQIVTNSFIRYSEKSIAEKEKIEEETLRIGSGK